MSTLAAAACDAFMRALEEARDLQERGACANELSELLRHARELLDIIEAEIADQAVSIPSYARAVLAQLRGRLEALERDCHADQALTPINPAGPLPA